MLAIAGSSFALATEDPVDENSKHNQILNKLDYGFTAIFAVEMVLKVKFLFLIMFLFLKNKDLSSRLLILVSFCILVRILEIFGIF